MMVMDIKQNVSLAQYSTMRLGGAAAYLTEIHNRNDVSGAVGWAKTHSLPCLMIGSGSNIFWTDKGYRGLVMVNKIQRFEIFEEDRENSYLTIGSGESWDKVVARSVELGLTGIETLSLIPGTTGATPIQNVGAYGQEIADTLVSVEAFDLASQSFLTMSAADCGLGYRTSRFKTTDKNRFFITAITLHLRHANPEPPFYASVQEYLARQHVTTYTPLVLREAVIAIRSAKLPDPAKVANNGSFFANPVIDGSAVNKLLERFPGLSYWHLPNGKTKLSAAWLIEQAGFKNIHDDETGMATWPSQALVLVNEHARNTSDLLKFRQKVIDGVKAKFGISLQQEPELLGDQ